VSRKRKILFAVLFFGILSSGIIWFVGGTLCEPRPRHIGSLPSDVFGEDVEFFSSSGSVLHGWLIPGKQGRPVIILMHGVRGSRLDMLGRARFLQRSGYSVLLFDFQAHGESPGEHITFGHLESKDATAAVEFVHERFPTHQVAVIGGSLGGAASILASPPLKVDAMILEMVYPTISQAVDARLRLRLGWFGPLLRPLLVWQLKPRLGIGVEVLRPIDRVKEIKVPKLFLAGSEEKHTRLSEARELFAAAAEPKEFWEIKGAAHEDLHAFGKEEYERRTLEFLNVALKSH
jgi:uncharacterized protein